MITKRKKILCSILLSLVLCFGAVHAGNVCNLEDRNCFVTFHAPACGSGCTDTENIDPEYAAKPHRLTKIPANCCDIRTCHPKKSLNTGIQQSGRHIQHIDFRIAHSLVHENQYRLYPGINHAAPRARIKLYTLVQSFLC